MPETTAVLEHLAANGSDMSQPMFIDFHIAVPSVAAGVAVGEAALALGYEVECAYDEDEDEWTCTCSKSMVATHAAVTACELELDALAEPHEGFIDGFGSFGNGD